MRRCRAALAVLTIILTSLIVAGPAAAGGPTSVLLVAPETGRTASLYTGQTDYEALAGYVGAFAPPLGRAATPAPSQTEQDFGPSVTLTWLIHDIQVWRVDRVYVGAGGVVRIATQSTDGGSVISLDNPPSWHTAARGKELAALLDRLGVGSGSRAGKRDAVAPGNGAESDAGTVADASPAVSAAPAVSALPAAVTESKEPAAQPTGAHTPGTGGSWWGFAGLALGVVLGVAGTRLFSNTRTDGGEPATEGADTIFST